MVSGRKAWEVFPGPLKASVPPQFPADVPSLTEPVPAESEPPALQNNLLSPLLTGTESPFDLEQQWQDLMSIMEMQVGLSGRR